MVSLAYFKTVLTSSILFCVNIRCIFMSNAKKVFYSSETRKNTLISFLKNRKAEHILSTTLLEHVCIFQLNKFKHVKHNGLH